MNNILQFKKKLKPLGVQIVQQEEAPMTTIKGEAVCLCCKYEWVAVIPIGQIDFLCPKCKTRKGVHKGLIEWRGESHFQCDCGSTLFYLLNDGQNQCPTCGVIFNAKDHEND